MATEELKPVEGLYDEDNVFEDIKYRPAVIARNAMDILVNFGRPDACLLYLYYYHAAIWRDTEYIWCTIEQAAQDTGLSPERVRQAKKALLTYHLIEEEQPRNDVGRLNKRWIFVKWQLSQEDVDHITNISAVREPHTVENMVYANR